MKFDAQYSGFWSLLPTCYRAASFCPIFFKRALTGPYPHSAQGSQGGRGAGPPPAA